MRRITTMWLVLVAAATLAFSGQSDEIPYQWNGVERIIAIGDVHGGYEGLVSILQQTALVEIGLGLLPDAPGQFQLFRRDEPVAVNDPGHEQ